MANKYFLGIDQGSHSSRAVLFNGDGEVVEQASRSVTPARPSAGRVEYEAGALLGSVENAVNSVLAALGKSNAGQVSACGIATQRSTVLAWDAQGNALSRALSWQDVRGNNLVDKLRTHEQDISEISGLPLTPYYSASKMRWLLQHEESVGLCDRAELRLSPLASYLLFHLLDNRAYKIDYSNAQRTQLFDLNALTWSQRLCRWFGVDAAFLPDCSPMCSDYGRLLATSTPVTAVCGDQNAAIYGAGMLVPGVALVNIGSGAFILRELARFSNSKQLTGIAYADADSIRYMREATINGAGNALSWAEQQWGEQDLVSQLPGWLREVTEPPVFINAVGGLGTPWMRSDIRSTFIGKASCSNAEKAVAIIESIVFMIQANLELMAVEAPLKSLRVSGGLSNLDGLCQRLSDLSGYVVERSDVAEATARGAAWLAAGRPRHWQSDSAEADAGMRFTPQKSEGLACRYRLFRTELEQALKTNQRTEARP